MTAGFRWAKRPSPTSPRPLLEREHHLGLEVLRLRLHGIVEIDLVGHAGRLVSLLGDKLRQGLICRADLVVRASMHDHRELACRYSAGLDVVLAGEILRYG